MARCSTMMTKHSSLPNLQNSALSPAVAEVSRPPTSRVACTFTYLRLAFWRNPERSEMRRHLLLFVCMAAFATTLVAQTVDSTVCDILSNPLSFDGKIVRIKGTVIAGFDEFLVKDPNCKEPGSVIWLAYPEGTKAKGGPVASVTLQLAKNSPGAVSALPDRTPVTLDKNKDFKQFDSLLAAPPKINGMCLGCTRYTVAATLTGRLDLAKSMQLSRKDGKFVAAEGFGNMNRYPVRLVLQSVSDVTPHEIDYASAAAETKGDSTQDSPSGDAVAAAHQIAKAFPAGSAASLQVEEAAAAFGKKGEDNGVVVGFGPASELSKPNEGKGGSDSPDGLLIKCTFDMDRLRGNALAKAIVHVGTHIADLRQGRSTSPFESEQHAWRTVVLSAVGSGQKTLTAPGGHVLWNAAWPSDQRTQKVNDAINNFLANWLFLSN